MKQPPFCPNPRCKYHTNPPNTPWFIHKGSFPVKRTTLTIPRFCCKNCGKTCSTRTFDIDYWTHASISYRKLLAFLSSSMSIRSLGRNLGCSPQTILNRISRLARQCIAVNALIIPSLSLREDLAADGFESFVVSQYFPNNFNILAGKDSQFVYSLSYAQLRRKGAMTEQQKKQAQTLKKRCPLPPNQIIRSFYHLTDVLKQLLLDSSPRFCFLATDEKREYQPPIQELQVNLLREGILLQHQMISSQEVRNRDNPLFSPNYMDREFRKDLAEHRRETVCFARNTVCSMERMVVYLFYHNFLKPFRINVKDRTYATHAEAAGIAPKVYQQMMRGMFRKRSWLHMVKVPLPEELVWRRAMITPKNMKTAYCPQYVLA